jgi:uncharacterized protein (UPF0332 family)
MGFADDAGRAAYLAAFHAAQALISERTHRISKTHAGVHSQFNLLTKGDFRVGTELRRFLSDALDKDSCRLRGRSGGAGFARGSAGGNYDRDPLRRPHCRDLG